MPPRLAISTAAWGKNIQTCYCELPLIINEVTVSDLFTDATVGARDHVRLTFAANLQIFRGEFLGRGQIPGLGILGESLAVPDYISVERHLVHRKVIDTIDKYKLYLLL